MRIDISRTAQKSSHPNHALADKFGHNRQNIKIGILSLFRKGVDLMSVEELGSLGVFVWRVGSRNVMKLLVGEQKKTYELFRRS